MNQSFLITKLEPPAIHNKIIQRPRLAGLLNAFQPLNLIIAPAGYGKTTLIADWLGNLKQPDDRFFWLTLDEQDNASKRFWTYLAAGFQRTYPLFKYSAEHLQADTLHFDDPGILNPFLNEIAKIPGRVHLILDNYHLIENNDIHRSLNYLLEYIPANLHVYLLSRWMPPIAVSRMRAQNRIVEIDTKELAFTPSEEVEYLVKVQNHDPESDVSQLILSLSEGWITGLQMISVAAADDNSPTDNIRQIDEFISDEKNSDFILEDVLAQCSPQKRDFMIKSSLLTRLNATLCDAVLQRSDSEDMLYALEAENLFINSLDKTHTWYRYNPLFARFLHNYLSTQFPDLVEPLHIRAFHWFKEKGETADAIYHALAGKQMAAAADILEKTTYQTLQDSNYNQISEWINQLAEKELNQHPFLYVYQAFADSMLGKVPFIEIRLTEAENALARMNAAAIAPDEQKKLSWYIQIIRGINKIKYYNAHEGIVEVKNLVANAPAGTKYIVETANSFLGEALVQMGLMKEAQRAFKQAIAADEDKVNLVGHFYFHIGLARSYKLGGQLKQAEQENLVAIQMTQKYGLDESLTMLPQFMISMIAMDRAKPALNEIWVNYFRSQPNWFETSSLQWEYIVLIELFLVRLLLSVQNLTAAKLYFDKVNHSFEAHQQPPAYWPVEYIDMQTRIWLAEKDFATAEKELINRIEILKATNNALTREYVSLGRVLYAAGRYEQALPYLTESIEQARQTEQGELLLESLILLSLVYDQISRKDEAIQQIGKAVMIAESQGYIRLFTEMGPAMKSLLERYWKNITSNQPVMHSANELFFLKNLIDSPELIGENLKEENGQSIFNLPVRQPEIEPLSSREQEVMQLVLRGMSAKQVAAALQISSNTAKTHIRNIYRKYGVGSIHELIKIVRI